MTTTRRQLLGGAVAAGVGAAAAPALSLARPPAALAAPGAAGVGSSRTPIPPLVDDPRGRLALPPGFSYRLVSVAGSTELLDGPGGRRIGRSPGRPDGTGSFAAGGAVRLVQNHELEPGGDNLVPHVKGTVYDPDAVAGGCTVIELDRRGRRVSEWVGLSGTSNNCAGGRTPWGSWLSCEEYPVKAGESGFSKDHGYVFEVFPGPADRQLPRPIKALGRFSHEAAVVEAGRHRMYLTEDTGSTPAAENGLFYRYTAPHGTTLGPGLSALTAHGGSLQAMAVRLPDGSVLPDLAYLTSAQIGRPFRVSWVGGVEDRTAQQVEVRFQFSAEVTRGHKLEGAWASADGVFFNSSYNQPGDSLPTNAQAHDGQVWFYNWQQQTLTLVAYFPYGEQLHTGDPDRLTPFPGDYLFDGPDNLTVTPYGGLVIAEDGDTINHLLSWRPGIGVEALARNMINTNEGSTDPTAYAEMTGPNFSPDGTVLHANIQEPGHTFAITGPWQRTLS